MGRDDGGAARFIGKIYSPPFLPLAPDDPEVQNFPDEVEICSLPLFIGNTTRTSTTTTAFVP